ncbi:MAG TPA: DUF3185 family protein [Desulfuromonadales bacterium]|jgi:hypothetical protein
MANDSNTIKLALGLALLVAGGFLFWWGHSESQSLANQLSRAIAGAHSDRVMWKYIGGAVCSVVGVVLLVRK